MYLPTILAFCDNVFTNSVGIFFTEPCVSAYPFSLEDHWYRVTHAVLPEDLQDILVLIFREMVMRYKGLQVEATGFRNASDDDLDYAFYLTVNEMVHRMY